MQTQKNGKTCIHALSTVRKRKHRIDAYESEDSAEDDDVEEKEEEGALRAIGRFSDRASICFVFKILPVLFCDAVNHRGAHISSSLRCFVSFFSAPLKTCFQYCYFDDPDFHTHLQYNTPTFTHLYTQMLIKQVHGNHIA